MPWLVSDIEQDLAEMLTAGLVLEGGNHVLQGEMPVDHGLQGRGAESADKILLLVSIADQHGLRRTWREGACASGN